MKKYSILEVASFWYPNCQGKYLILVRAEATGGGWRSVDTRRTGSGANSRNWRLVDARADRLVSSSKLKKKKEEVNQKCGMVSKYGCWNVWLAKDEPLKEHSKC